MKKEHEKRKKTWDDLRKTRPFQFYIANEVIIGNAVALLLGDWITSLLFVSRYSQPPEQIASRISHLDMFFSAFCVVVLSLLTIL